MSAGVVGGFVFSASGRASTGVLRKADDCGEGARPAAADGGRGRFNVGVTTPVGAVVWAAVWIVAAVGALLSVRAALDETS